MLWINDFAAALAVSQLALLGSYFHVKSSGTLARVIALYCLCLGAYTLSQLSFVSTSDLTTFLLFRLATLAPLLLWYISFTMFVDDEKIAPWVWVAMAVCVLARGIGMALALAYPQILDSPTGYLLIITVPQVILLYFAVSTFYMAWVGHRNDLEERRRRVRIQFVMAMGFVIITIVGSSFVNLFNFLFPNNWVISPYGWPGLLVSLYIFAAAYLFNLKLFRIDEDALTLLAPVRKTALKDPAATQGPAPATRSKQVQHLTDLMQNEKLYTRTGLTIAELATALDLQEYRLRRLINQEMGYRNFNQFLNNYRIEDAQQRLLNSDLSISNIALDVGYASLSVFNKAFKERYSLTPREYRLQHKTDAHPAESTA